MFLILKESKGGIDLEEHKEFNNKLSRLVIYQYMHKLNSLAK